MKKIISIVLFFISTGNCFAQQVTFLKSYLGLSNIDDEGSSMDFTFDGGYIIAGTTNITSFNSMDFILVKTDSFGDPSWIKTIGGPNEDFAYSVIQTNDSGFVITGNMHISNDDYYALLIKTDVNGNTLWAKTFHGSGCSDFAYCVKKTFDGGLIVAGVRADLSNFNRSIFLIKTDNNGDTVWTRSFGNGGADYVEQTSDSGFIISGNGLYQHNVYLVKTDKDGIPVWSKTYGDNSEASGQEVHQTTDGGYIICGYTENTPAIYLVKTDSAGDTLWTKQYAGPNVDEAYSIVQTTDGGYIVTGLSVGSFQSYVDLIKTDSIGNISWVKATINGYDQYFTVRQTNDGGYVVQAGIGFSNSLALSLMKTDSSGNAGCNQINLTLNQVPMTTQITSLTDSLIPYTTIVTVPTLTETIGGNFHTFCFFNSIVENFTKSSVITISPNPTADNFTITFPNTINKGVIEIYNVLGKKIFSEDVFNVSQKEIRLSNINAGIYFVKVFLSGGEGQNTSKLVVQ